MRQLAILAVLACIGAAPVQKPRTRPVSLADEVRELRALVAALRAENAALRVELAKLKPAPATRPAGLTLWMVDPVTGNAASIWAKDREDAIRKARNMRMDLDERFDGEGRPYINGVRQATQKELADYNEFMKAVEEERKFKGE